MLTPTGDGMIVMTTVLEVSPRSVWRAVMVGEECVLSLQ